MAGSQGEAKIIQNQSGDLKVLIGTLLVWKMSPKLSKMEVRYPKMEPTSKHCVARARCVGVTASHRHSTGGCAHVQALERASFFACVCPPKKSCTGELPLIAQDPILCDDIEMARGLVVCSIDFSGS